MNAKNLIIILGAIILLSFMGMYYALISDIKLSPKPSSTEYGCMIKLGKADLSLSFIYTKSMGNSLNKDIVFKESYSEAKVNLGNCGPIGRSAGACSIEVTPRDRVLKKITIKGECVSSFNNNLEMSTSKGIFLPQY